MTRIKICGITDLEFLKKTQKLDIHAVGFIFYKPSKRNISIECAQKLVQNITPFIQVIAVFVDPSSELVEGVLSRIPIHTLQFHGNESEEFCRSFKRPYIKAISLAKAQDFHMYEQRYQSASALLLDNSTGGIGQIFDWNLIPKLRNKPIIIAGGINSDNVASLLTLHNVDAIDLSSGIEDSQGKKCVNKLSKLIKAVRKVNDKL